MFISEVRSRGIKYRGRFSHRKYFETLEEGLECGQEILLVALLLLVGTLMMKSQWNILR